MRAKYLLQCLLAASWLATGALAHGHAAGGHHSFPPATRRLAGAGPMRRRCAVGEKLTSSQRLKRERNFYATVIQRFGADSAQARVFIPSKELPAAREASAKLPPRSSLEASSGLSPEALARLTDRVAALEAAALAKATGNASALTGARRKLLQTGGDSYTIPTYVHAITDSSNTGYVSDTLIKSQMQVLNAAYNQWGFSFTLAGTKRYKNNNWSPVDPESSTASALCQQTHVGGLNTLNLWFTDIGQDLLGACSLAADAASYGKEDGCFIAWHTLPGADNDPYFDEGDTVVHEVGHWLGLWHTFDGKCARDVNKGDFVADTPAERIENSETECNDNRNTCKGKRGGLAGNDPIHNFMDYSADSCLNEFTEGQGARMLKQFATYRG